jgi:hypothetical protein
LLNRYSIMRVDTKQAADSGERGVGILFGILG